MVTLPPSWFRLSVDAAPVTVMMLPALPAPLMVPLPLRLRVVPLLISMWPVRVTPLLMVRVWVPPSL